MAIYDRKGAAKRIGKDLRTIYRWEALGVLKFTLERVRESDLLEADKAMRSRRGRPRKESNVVRG